MRFHLLCHAIQRAQRDRFREEGLKQSGDRIGFGGFQLSDMNPGGLLGLKGQTMLRLRADDAAYECWQQLLAFSP